MSRIEAFIYHTTIQMAWHGTMATLGTFVFFRKSISPLKGLAFGMTTALCFQYSFKSLDYMDPKKSDMRTIARFVISAVYSFFIGLAMTRVLGVPLTLKECIKITCGMITSTIIILFSIAKFVDKYL